MQGKAENVEESSFTRRPTTEDVGIGLLFFFTSHMVIRTMFYIGVDRSATDLTVFFIVVMLSLVVAHLFAPQFLKLRLQVNSLFGIPAVSVLATLGVALALISMLPVANIGFFYAGGGLMGFSCGWLIVIWTSTIHPGHPHRDSFFIDPALIIAVAAYMLFRLMSTVSATIADGFLLALPLITITCIISNRRCRNTRKQENDNDQALLVLVCVAAVFALGCSVVVFLSGHENLHLYSGVNYMVFFELIAIALMLFCSWLLYHFAEHGVFPRGTAVLVPAIICIPLFLMGVLMGSMGIPDDSPSTLWECNIWVLLIAIFAYDIRNSLYAVKGLALGVMFEAMCMGQLCARLVIPQPIVGSNLAIGVIGALYFLSIFRQMLRGTRKSRKHQAMVEKNGGHVEMLTAPILSQVPHRANESRNTADEVNDGISTEVVACCDELGTEYGLTQREIEILALLSIGRSAKYIADALMISHNTTRTHIRHVYEKLNIHSKQELIDLVHHSQHMTQG